MTRMFVFLTLISPFLLSYSFLLLLLGQVSILVEEMIKNRREAASVTPSATKTGTVRSSQTGRDTIASQRDTLYNYFNRFIPSPLPFIIRTTLLITSCRKTDPNVEENDSKPSGILSFLRFRSVFFHSLIHSLTHPFESDRKDTQSFQQLVLM